MENNLNQRFSVLQGTDYIWNLSVSQYTCNILYPRCILDSMHLQKVYGGQNVRTIKARCKEHPRSIRLHQPESAAAEHSINTHHCINFSGTSVFNRTSEYVDCLVNKATEICQNKNTFNRSSGFVLSQAWSPITKLLMRVIWGLRRARTWLHPPTMKSHSQLQRESISRCRQTLEVVSFHGEDRDGPWNVCWLTIQPADMVASPRIFYWIQ